MPQTIQGDEFTLKTIQTPAGFPRRWKVIWLGRRVGTIEERQFADAAAGYRAFVSSNEAMHETRDFPDRAAAAAHLIAVARAADVLRTLRNS